MDLKHPKINLYPCKKQPLNMPELLRKHGIASKREFIFALAPYFEWISTAEIKVKYQKVFEVKSKHDILRPLNTLVDDGYFEKAPGPISSKKRPTVLWRRIQRTYIDTSRSRAARLEGRLFAQEKKLRTPRRTDNLTMDDIRFIQQYEGKISKSELSRMFKIHIPTVTDIQAGSLPLHLKKKRSE